MSSEGSVTHWLGALRNGQQEVAQHELCNRYFERLVQLARQKLRGLPQRAEDEEDVALSTLDSFFHGVQQGRYPDLNDRTGLWPLLVTITASKSFNQLKRQRAAKRGGGRVRGESIFEHPEHSAGGIEQLVSEQLTPEMVVLMTEECERLMASLANDELRRVACMKLEGYDNGEIARELDVVERTVERRLQRIRREWSVETES